MRENREQQLPFTPSLFTLAAGLGPTMNSGYASERLFDKQAALKRLGGSMDLLKDMFQFFIEDAPVLLDTLDKSLAEEDTEEAYRAAHSLKGLASNFDADAVTGPAKQIEEHLRKKDLDSARSHAVTVRKAVSDCIAAGKAILNYPDNPPVQA